MQPVSDFDFDLPPELIAQEPSAIRDQARLFCLDRKTQKHLHHRICDLPTLLKPGDLLVANDTRVYPARLLGRREPSGGAVECLLLARVDRDCWDVLLHPGQKLKEGASVIFERDGFQLRLEVLAKHFHGRRTVRLTSENATDIDQAIDAIGHIPLPPYIKRPDLSVDRDRYQTVYARARGSVAAPTAGLHFTPELLDALDAKCIERTTITLHVGFGTFQPIRSEHIQQHHLDAERFEVTKNAAALINTALDEGRRVVAVGTTTTRVLEACARLGRGRVQAGTGSTRLYIYPEFDFQVVGALLTNFHLPRSSLLVLVCAFASRQQALSAYAEAVADEYRFYSYGDAMLIT
jgi:S-adenosylmethionine:tRNA ribosyltransferase-isomerase